MTTPEITAELLAQLGPELEAKVKNRLAKVGERQTQINALEDHISALVAKLGEYRDLVESVGPMLEALEKAGGSTAELPSYAEYRKAHGMDVHSRGRNTSLQTIAEWISEGKPAPTPKAPKVAAKKSGGKAPAKASAKPAA